MSLKDVPIGENAPNIINAVVEIPAKSNVKYEYDEKLDVIKVDRVLHSPMFYPAEYGFVPETRAEDGDHLDILIISSQPLMSGSVIEVRPIGALDMEDNEGIDWKLLSVPTKDSRFSDITNIDQINIHIKNEIQHFFEQYKHLEGKWVNVQGWHDVNKAYQCIIESKERFSREG